MANSNELPVTGLVSMVKNEADIIADWLAHVTDLFDHIVIADHNSTDGTFEYLKAVESKIPERLKIVRYIEPEYDQARLMNFLAEGLLAREAGISWITSLDADEFLTFGSRDEFVRFLKRLQGRKAFTLLWKNCAPLLPNKGNPRTDSWFIPPQFASHGKVFWSRQLFLKGTFVMGQGNHFLEYPKGKRTPSSPKAEGHLYHLPLRTQDQFRLKICQGIIGYWKQGRRRNNAHGAHWFELFRKLADSHLSKSDLNRIALQYGETDSSETAEMTDESLLATGYVVQKLPSTMKGVRCEDALPTPMWSEMTAECLRTIARSGIVDQEKARTLSQEWNLEQSDDLVGNSLRANHLHYTTLSSTGNKAGVSSADEIRKELMQCATWDIETLVPTSWGEHIPFMLAVVSILRPRVFVELGTHHGASFFAVCQALKRREIGGQAIAVDTWSGDSQAGFYDNSVLERFEHLLDQRYKGIGRYLKMYFDEAAERFDNGSIDLLHIDGLHTYEAVSHDFKTWKDKVSPGGVILFHDINVYTKDFGVWRLWKELKKQYQTFEFLHCHGLGILFMPGAADGSPAQRLAAYLSNETEGDILRHFFASVGELSLQRKLLSFENQDLKQSLKSGRGNAQSVGAATPMAEQPEVLRLHHELQLVYNSTSWRVTAPLRWLKRRLTGSN
ncbi:class I SAM-dependent methyltransferase [Limibacillus sp. MBR-115]|jgi:hypothetical protein|uniref:class I SAM-dependent methyltransferase n=1 Tax=Limibacillus sp. MBR-115 TaxID=3156465 RepID=UPI003395EC7D